MPVKWRRRRAIGDEVHPSAQCPECRLRVVRISVPGAVFWGCEGFPLCRGRLPADPDTGEPVQFFPEVSLQDREELRQRVKNLARDERASEEDLWSMVFARVERRVWLAQLTHAELVLARQLLLQLAETLPSQVRSRPVPEPPSCCTTRRDAWGAYTVCTARMRWCLGAVEHATRAGQGEDTRGTTWGDGYESEDALCEAAEAAFIDADSRRA